MFVIGGQRNSSKIGLYMLLFLHLVVNSKIVLRGSKIQRKITK